MVGRSDKLDLCDEAKLVPRQTFLSSYLTQADIFNCVIVNKVSRFYTFGAIYSLGLDPRSKIGPKYVQIKHNKLLKVKRARAWLLLTCRKCKL